MQTVIFLLLIVQWELFLVGDTQWVTNPKLPIPVIESFREKVFFEERFQEPLMWSRWIRSEVKDEQIYGGGKRYDGEWAFEIPQLSVYQDDYGLVMKSKIHRYAISTQLDQTFDFSITPLIVQYEVRFQSEQECGGAYIKLLSNDRPIKNLASLTHEPSLLKTNVTEETPYTIMFGPEKCDSDYKYHFVIRYRDPETGITTEHHAKQPTESFETIFSDGKTHLFKLVFESNLNFEMYIDDKLYNAGNLMLNFEPPIVAPAEIINETDVKPADWDEREKIVDESAVKPDDWDEDAPIEITDSSATMPDDWLENEPLLIPDPSDTKPDTWEDQIDGVWRPITINNPRCQYVSGCGEWTPPTIPNPNYRGRWSPPLIDNPNYRGKWSPRRIENSQPNITQLYLLTPVDALTLELWSKVDEVVFDNFIITSDPSVSNIFTKELWQSKFKLEQAIQLEVENLMESPVSMSVIDRIVYIKKEKYWLLVLCVLIGLCPAIVIALNWLHQKLTHKFDGNKKKDQDWIDSAEYMNAFNDHSSEIKDDRISDSSDIRVRRITAKD